jgi:hypothetical protein
MRKPHLKDARALAVLWLRCGEVADLIGAIKRNPRDPRNREVPKAEAAIAKLEKFIERRDFAGATEPAYWLDVIFFNLRAVEAAPFTQRGRKQLASLSARRDAHNFALKSESSAKWAHWNAEATPYWKKPRATKNSVARFLKARLKLKESEGSIARRLRKPQQAS